MRRHALFIGVFILIAAAWSALLALSQTHVHSDEAIIGLMGKHILEGRYFPFYMYGQPYKAGAAWEAYLAAIAFAFFGVGVMTRIPGADLEGVRNYLLQDRLTGVWSTLSFVYPLLFECSEAFVVSDTIFGFQHRVYPEAIPWREPDPEGILRL